MVKGHYGESCAEALKSSIKAGEILTFSELFDRAKKRGDWKDSTIWQHLMMVVVNLPPARYHWPNKKPFLFLHGDGRYELYNKTKHPQPVE